MLGAEPRGGLALAMESTEEEKEEGEEEREEMQPFTTCPLHHRSATGNKTVSRIPVGLVMGTDNK